MNSDELYQEVLLQHSRRPKNHGPFEKVTCRAEGYNALCGDEITVEIRMSKGVAEPVQFQAGARGLHGICIDHDMRSDWTH